MYTATEKRPDFKLICQIFLPKRVCLRGSAPDPVGDLQRPPPDHQLGKVGLHTNPPPPTFVSGSIRPIASAPSEQKAVNFVMNLSDLRTFGLQNLRNEEPFISDYRTFGLQNLRTREQSPRTASPFCISRCFSIL